MEEKLVKVINKLTELFKALVVLFSDLEKAVDLRDIEKVNKIVIEIKKYTKDIENVESERMEYTKNLCEKYKIKDNARVLANTLKNPELTDSLNFLIQVLNDLMIKREAVMMIVKANLDYLNFSIDYFKKLLSFGNYNEKGETKKFVNLLDQEG